MMDRRSAGRRGCVCEGNVGNTLSRSGEHLSGKMSGTRTIGCFKSLKRGYFVIPSYRIVEGAPYRTQLVDGPGS